MVEGKELEDIAEKSSLLCSCFSVLENSIVYVSKCSDQDDDGKTSKVDSTVACKVFVSPLFCRVPRRNSAKVAHHSDGGTRFCGTSVDGCQPEQAVSTATNFLLARCRRVPCGVPHCDCLCAGLGRLAC